MRLRKKPVILVALAVVAAAVAFFVFRHSPVPVEKPFAAAPAADAPILAPDDEVHAQYAGSESCRACHAAEFEKWHTSNHGLAERKVSKDEDFKAFSPKQSLLHGKDRTEVFVDADGLAKSLTLGLDHQRRAYPVIRVIGNNPLRQFLIPAPGHLSALRRTRSGKFTLDRAVPVMDLKTTPREDLLKAMISLAEISLMRGA